MVKQAQEKDVGGLNRRQELSDKLNSILRDLHSKSNGESSSKKICVVIDFNESPRRFTREERGNMKETLKKEHPTTVSYLELNGIRYVPLGSTGDIIAEVTPAQIEELVGLNGEIKQLDYTQNKLESYFFLFRKR